MSRKRTTDLQRARHRKEMGKRLVVARGRRTPQEIADHLRVPRNTYLGWERGRTSMPMYLVLPFCELTQFPPGFVVTGVPDQDFDVRLDETQRLRLLKKPKPTDS